MSAFVDPGQAEPRRQVYTLIVRKLVFAQKGIDVESILVSRTRRKKLSRVEGGEEHTKPPDISRDVIDHAIFRKASALFAGG
ncbi:hypothetical protein AXG89_29620 (plasmid) [Burkholderia sp. PAMC 26561]|nr:hypothetical protein AXG89_23060 [Burkholderia sp. PAMC 26561]AME27982.1 hypothetical protein AXG89_29620 [Burkholderia sp. PAMC 26561]